MVHAASHPFGDFRSPVQHSQLQTWWPDSEVRIDESFVGSRKQNMHKNRARPDEQQGGAQGRPAFYSALQ